LKARQTLYEPVLQEGNVRVALGEFLSDTTRVELEKLTSQTIHEDSFNRLWEYWKEKRMSIQHGSVPLLPRLRDDIYVMRCCSMKDQEVKMYYAKLRWIMLKAKLLPKKYATLQPPQPITRPTVEYLNEIEVESSEKDSVEAISYEAESNEWSDVSQEESSESEEVLALDQVETHRIRKPSSQYTDKDYYTPKSFRRYMQSSPDRKRKRQSQSPQRQVKPKQEDQKVNTRISDTPDYSSKLLFKVDQETQAKLLQSDKKSILEEQTRKTRPPTRRKPPSIIAHGIPTYYGSGDNRITWMPNVQVAGKNEVLFGAGFTSQDPHKKASK
jgi:hypothetical protein